MICIIDYGSGNVGALQNIFRRRRIPHFLTADPLEFKRADRFLLPGVGAFDPTMVQLSEAGIVSALEQEVFGNDKPILGICVGMHLLANGSEEGQLPGLGWIEGVVRKIDVSGLNRPPHLPHMGWNSIQHRGAAPLFRGVDIVRGYYFLHSYYFDARHDHDVTARVSYGGDLPCAVHKGNVFGVQFHPEKSHGNGEMLLQNFSEFSRC
jgi:glutamine amidotransferase